jgi:hypothetical protein
MILPTIHLNGTSKAALVDDLCEASAAIDAAYQSLKKCAPNGRDYYPQGPDALKAATDEHMGRLRALDAVKSDVDQFLIAIDELS